MLARRHQALPGAGDVRDGMREWGATGLRLCDPNPDGGAVPGGVQERGPDRAVGRGRADERYELRAVIVGLDRVTG